MELKQFDAYTKEEIKELLYHWFNYYGTRDCSLEEYAQFTKIVEQDPKHTFEVAAILCNKGFGSTPLLEALRGNKAQLEALISEYNTFENVTKKFLQSDFIDEVVSSYNNPDESISKEDRKLRQKIRDLTGKNYNYLPKIDWTKLDSKYKDKIKKIVKALQKAKTNEEKIELGNQLFRILQEASNVTINPERVKEIFISCMFNESDIKDGRPTKMCSIIEGINDVYFLDTEKINKYRMEIRDLVDLLPDLREPTSFEKLFFDRANRNWTSDPQLVELLIVLGIATERIEYRYPQEELRAKNHGLPVLVEKDNRSPRIISGYQPSEIDEILEAIEAREKQSEYSDEDLSENIEIFKLQYPHIEPVMKMSGYSIILEGNNFYLCRADGEKIKKMSVEIKLGSFSLVARDNEYSIKYTYSVDGNCAFGGQIDRNILSINGLKKLDDNAFDGRQIVIELGNGLVNASYDPRFEIMIIEPNNADIITRYEIDEFGFTVAIENDEGKYGNKVDGTNRTVSYTDVASTPSNKVYPILICERVANGNTNIINIDGYVESTFTHALLQLKSDGSGKTIILSNPLKPTEEVMKVADEYLKTSRVKNLYNHVSSRVENLLPGMQEFIRKNYPLSNKIETIMQSSASPEFEERLNSNAINNTDLPEDKNGVKKELKPEDN